ncbi:MAG TPA: homoserine dehydrogenase [Luteimonas sp.]|nr:homoserine dehydrogenase [Luteimonas sp.]
MSAVLAQAPGSPSQAGPARPALAAGVRPPAPRLALLGTGTVGRAFVDRCERLRAMGHAVPRFAWLANSRACHDAAGGDDATAGLAAIIAAPREAVPSAVGDGLQPGDVVVDATASEAVAERHAGWLGRGIHVVTANKLGAGGPLVRAGAITQASARGGGRYGDGATVGAGLPVLHCVRALIAGGDRIHAVDGLLSGSLGWLFDRFDGSVPFSELVAAAATGGFTEPDPRCDLSGEDIRRKLLILARAAGFDLHTDDVAVESLLTPALSASPVAALAAVLPGLDAGLAVRAQAAASAGCVLRMVGRVDAHGARVALRSLPPGHALRGGRGTDNRVAIWSDRYRDQPLIIQGPGAGADVTAAALLDDVLAIAG